MKNKIMVNIIVPVAELNFDIYLPVNKKVGTLKKYLLQTIIDETDGCYKGTLEHLKVIDQESGEEYSNDVYLNDSGIKNGSTIILI